MKKKVLSIIREIVGNFAADGFIDETIVVCPNMYATSDPEQKPGFDNESCLLHFFDEGNTLERSDIKEHFPIHAGELLIMQKERPWRLHS